MCSVLQGVYFFKQNMIYFILYVLWYNILFIFFSSLLQQKFSFWNSLFAQFYLVIIIRAKHANKQGMIFLLPNNHCTRIIGTSILCLQLFKHWTQKKMNMEHYLHHMYRASIQSKKKNLIVTSISSSNGWKQIFAWHISNSDWSFQSSLPIMVLCNTIPSRVVFHILFSEGSMKRLKWI